MKFYTQAFLLLSTILVCQIYRQYRNLTEPKSLPEFDFDAYWGPGSKETYIEKNDTVLSQIRYKDEPIAKLRSILNETRKLHPPLEGVRYEYGVNSESLLKWIDYWRDDYLVRWLSREVIINSVPHFITQIQGLSIHYVHTKATYDLHNKTVIPLLLLHGWPGSMREFLEIIPMLALPDRDELDYVFEVVAPSLPGYGYSQGSSKPGFGIAEMAIVLKNLMSRLGYERFFIQGGDWGSLLGSAIATIFPENVIGYHSNMCTLNTPLANIKGIIASYFPSKYVQEKYQSFHFPMSKTWMDIIMESGYFHIQATKPDTIGIALTTNPVGLAAYILEKFSTWTNSGNKAILDGGWDRYDQKYKDGILDIIMIYYLTNSITSSMRLYSEALTFNQLSYQLDRIPITVPTGCARFKYDIQHSLDWQLEDKYLNLVHSTYHNYGGHFIAMEEPEKLYKDFAVFVKKVVEK